MSIFEGVKVVDFTHAYAGPFATLNLADFGAEVIKIERRGSGDVSRGWGPFKNDNSGYYSSFNRGKKSITLNIKKEEGKKIIFDLVKDADIVVSNFKAGTLDKIGIGYETMKKIKPDIIYATISGFGEKGVLSSFAAYDNVVQAVSGIMDVTGFEDKDPTKIGPAIGDSYTGLMLFMGIAIAYYNRMKTGKGQKVDTTMLGSLMNLLGEPIIAQTGLSKKVTRKGNSNFHYAPCDAYKVKDGYITLAVKNQKMWETFAQTIKREDLLKDERFKSNQARIENRKVLDEIINEAIKDEEKKELERLMIEKEIPCAAVSGIAEAFENEHLISRDMIKFLDDKGTGKIAVVGNPMKMEKDLPVIEEPSPLLGEHTEEILSKLGYDSEKIEELKNKEVI